MDWKIAIVKNESIGKVIFNGRYLKKGLSAANTVIGQHVIISKEPSGPIWKIKGSNLLSCGE